MNGLVIARVIVIGEYTHFGRRYEPRPLVLSSIYKALLFGLLVFSTFPVEEVLEALVDGVNIVRMSHEIRQR